MKRKILCLIFALCCISLCLVSCNNSDDNNSNPQTQNEDIKKCLNDLKTGLQNRFDLDSNSSSEYYANCASTELKAMSQYKDYDFNDSEFEDIINDYIDALNSQEEGAQYLYTDGKKFEEMYYEKGYDVRKECLQKLHDDYSFEVDDDYSDSFNNVLTSNRPKVLNLGEQVNIKTELGKLKVSVDGVIKSGENKTDTSIEKGYDIFLVNLSVENISYSDEYNTDQVGAPNFMYIIDENGDTITDPYSQASPVGEYPPQAGGYWTLPTGRKNKAGIPYYLSEDNKHIIVLLVNKDGSGYMLPAEIK